MDRRIDNEESKKKIRRDRYIGNMIATGLIKWKEIRRSKNNTGGGTKVSRKYKGSRQGGWAVRKVGNIET